MVEHECQVCRKRYKTMRGQENHAKSHVGADISNVAKFQFLCKECNKSYKTVKGLNNHEISVHKSSTPENASSGGDTGACSATVCGQSVGTDVESGSGDWLSSAEYFPEEPFLEEVPLTESVEPTNEPDEQLSDEVASYFIEEDEAEEARRSSSQPNPSGSAAQKTAPKANPKKKALISCKVCKQAYYTLEGYINHQSGHAFVELYSMKAPNLDTVLQSSRPIYQETLEEMAREQPSAGHGEMVSSAIKKLLDGVGRPCSEEFVTEMCCEWHKMCLDFMSGKTFLFPSDLRTACTKGLAHYLVKPGVQSKLLELMQDCLGEKSLVDNIVLACIVRKFCSKLVTFVVSSMTDDLMKFCDVRTNTCESTSSVEFMQNIHYVGGSNICSVLRTAKAYASYSDEWRRVISVLKSNFMVNDNNTSPSAEVSEWTDAQSHGGLIKLCDAATNFFLTLARLVKPLERIDGSVVNEEVFQCVCESQQLLVLWDLVIQNSIVKTESMKLLHALVCHFCVTWRNGIISRRMDEVEGKKKSSQQGKSGLAFRATI